MEGGSSLSQSAQALILPIAFLVIFYLLAIRPQQKREKKVRDMRDALRVGDEIITIGGIYGKIVRVKEDIVTIEVGSGKTKFDITKWAVGSTVNEREDKKETKKEDKKEVKKESKKNNVKEDAKIEEVKTEETKVEEVKTEEVNENNDDNKEE